MRGNTHIPEPGGNRHITAVRVAAYSSTCNRRDVPIVSRLGRPATVMSAGHPLPLTSPNGQGAGPPHPPRPVDAAPEGRVLTEKLHVAAAELVRIAALRIQSGMVGEWQPREVPVSRRPFPPRATDEAKCHTMRTRQWCLGKLPAGSSTDPRNYKTSREKFRRTPS
jgi:hypothetical protein